MSERKPFMSDGELVGLFGFAPLNAEHLLASGDFEEAERVRRWHERRITEGKLLPVVEVTPIEHQETENGKVERCSRCKTVIGPMDKWCSGCAGKVTR